MDSLQYLLNIEKFGIKFGLSNIRTISAALGNPQNTYRSVLIAGTNGKGSVTAIVAAALRAAGLRVGRYTSPHLIRVEERFAIDGTPVETSVLVGLIDEVRALIDRLLASGALEAPPTFFEVTTAIAFELFRRAGVEVAVLEVGMGGRLDSTNSVEPVAVAITSIDFDHQHYLGSTLAAIAAEKGGVIRAGIPVIVGPLPPEARNVLIAMCRTTGGEYVEAEGNVVLESKTGEGRTFLRLATPVRDYGWIPLGLRGAHQVSNAIVAVRLLERLEPLVGLKPDAIVSGLRDVRWPGRLQMVAVGGGRRLLLDAAHNPAGASALAAYLVREFPEPLPVVFGAMRDKDATLMLKALLPAASSMVMTEPTNPRARPALELAAMARALSPRATIDVEPAPRAALERAFTHGPLVCAAGSIFLVGDLLGSLGPEARDV